MPPLNVCAVTLVIVVEPRVVEPVTERLLSVVFPETLRLVVVALLATSEDE